MSDNEKNPLTDYSQFLGASEEHLTYAALSTYRNFAGELSQKEKMFFRHHLDACPVCSAKLREIDDVEGGVRVEEVRNIFRLSPNLFRYAIAALLVIAVGIAVVLVTLESPQEQIASQEISSDQPLAAATVDPEKFADNQILENFIGRNVRSTSGVILIAPRIGDTLSLPFAFQWEGRQTGKRFTVTVVDNKNVEMWREETMSTEIASEKPLEPGLYYIKLEMDGKLVQAGKFVVVR